MTHTHRLLTGVTVLTLAACGGSGGGMEEPTPAAPAAERPAPAAQPAPAGGGAFFTEQQAARGRDVFRSVCSECHYTTEFSSDDFRYSWRRRTADDLHGYIRDAMPEDAPGSLSAQEYLDIMAYILDLNEYPTGSTELTAAVLPQISLAGPNGG